MMYFITKLYHPARSEAVQQTSSKMDMTFMIPKNGMIPKKKTSCLPLLSNDDWENSNCYGDFDKKLERPLEWPWNKMLQPYSGKPHHVPSRIPSLSLVFFVCKKHESQRVDGTHQVTGPNQHFFNLQTLQRLEHVGSFALGNHVDMHPELSSPGTSAMFQCFYVEVRGLLIVFACSNKIRMNTQIWNEENNKKSCKQNKILGDSFRRLRLKGICISHTAGEEVLIPIWPRVIMADVFSWRIIGLWKNMILLLLFGHAIDLKICKLWIYVSSRFHYISLGSTFKDKCVFQSWPLRTQQKDGFKRHQSFNHPLSFEATFVRIMGWLWIVIYPSLRQMTRRKFCSKTGDVGNLCGSPSKESTPKGGEIVTIACY